MLGGIKNFIRTRLLTPEHPFLYRLNKYRIARNMAAGYKRHPHMTYAEIEAEIGRQYRERFGRTLNWDNPKTYNEKLHVAKLFVHLLHQVRCRLNALFSTIPILPTSEQ